MHQDATLYGCRPQPRGLCVRLKPSLPSPKRGQIPPPKFSAHVYYGETAGSIKMPLGTKVGFSPGDSVLHGHLALSPQRGGAPSPIFGPFLMWPNGWLHQDATWYGGRRQHRGLCVRWGPSPPSPSQKGGGARGQSPPLFDPCLLWPNGWMDQDGTWHGGRPWSSPYCARWGHSSLPQKGGRALQFSAHLYCGQMAGCIEMPLGMEVGLSPGDFVLDGDAAPYPKRGEAPPNFRHVSIVAK